MALKDNHTVLIVDGEKKIEQSLGNLLESLEIDYVYADSAQAGLDNINNAEQPFSIIITGQRLPKMEGAEFLEKAKELTPDSIRFLISGYSDVKAIATAVNRGSIHRFISMPWDNEILIETIKTCLNQYELTIENSRLFTLAKKQNSQLYTLNLDLKKNYEAHRKSLIILDKKIEILNKKLERGFESINYIHDIETILAKYDSFNEDKLNDLYFAAVADLFEQFEKIADQKELAMPDEIE